MVQSKRSSVSTVLTAETLRRLPTRPGEEYEDSMERAVFIMARLQESAEDVRSPQSVRGLVQTQRATERLETIIDKMNDIEPHGITQHDFFCNLIFSARPGRERRDLLEELRALLSVPRGTDRRRRLYEWLQRHTSLTGEVIRRNGHVLLENLGGLGIYVEELHEFHVRGTTKRFGRDVLIQLHNAWMAPSRARHML